MQHWTIVAISTLLLAAVAFIALEGGLRRVPEPAAPSAIPSSSAAPVATHVDAGPPVEAAPAPAPRPAASDVPPLPKDAPQRVRFGVILFWYEGAELAPKDARGRREAELLAKAAIEAAQKDFDEAVKLGDPGSTKDAGRIPRGVLEPHLEYALFTLEKGSVHPEPIDTPRGFWVVRRAD